MAMIVSGWLSVCPSTAARMSSSRVSAFSQVNVFVPSLMPLSGSAPGGPDTTFHTTFSSH